MSGHSKWATTHRQKAITDSKRGTIFTKLANNISVAARKGGDPEANSSLRTAIEKARAANMPKDNIERAIKKGTGELDGAQVEELYYEALGPGGLQVVVKSVTDNKNRSASTIRHSFSKAGGSFGSVLWNFSQKGIFLLPDEQLASLDQDEFILELIDQGATDVQTETEGLTIYTNLTDFQKMSDYLKDKNLNPESADIAYVAQEKIVLSPEDQAKADRLLAELEDNEDVSDYYLNSDW